MGQAVAAGIGNLLRGAIDQMEKAAEASSNLTESINKTGVAFGESAKDIVAWSQNANTALGQSQRQALDAASSFGLLFKNIGEGTGPAADMSKTLVQLATDLSSIYNIPIADSLTKLQAGLIGEIRPLRDVNIFLTEAAVQQKALELGLAKTTTAISEQDKVLARYALILEQGKIASGDFARTSGELANSERILAAQQEDALTRIGDVIKPVKLAFVRGLSELITAVAPYGENIMNSLAQGLADGIVAILPVLQQVRALFTYWLKPGSPPKLLPDLTEWGKGAMKAYMTGWGDPDTSALNTLGSAIEGILRSAAGAGQIKETDLVARVFGSEKALVNAINEWRQAGSITAGTLDNIVRQAGPAGDAVSGLVTEYFNLQTATKGVTDAQDELNNVTRRYSDALAPINQQLDAVRAAQQVIRDNQRLEALGKDLQDPRATADQKQLDRLEIQQIQLERQATAIGEERDAAVNAAQAKIDAAKKEQDAQQKKFDQAQFALDQQGKTNDLIAEEINLRQRLADEALAAQTKAENELEAAQRKADAAAQRDADALLRWRLASTDTAGQLAIMQAELAKTVTNSADYYDILTQIIGLEERLQKERDAAGANDPLGALGGIIPPAEELQKQSAGITALSDALKKAFDALSGGDGKTVELAPAWQNFADALGTIGDAAKGAVPYIKQIIDLFSGGDNGKQLDTATDPLANVPGLKGFIPGLNTLINSLGLLKAALITGDWTPVWAAFTKGVNDILNSVDPKADPDTFAFYLWLNDTLIPAINLLAAGDWKDAIQLLSAPINAMVDNAYQQGHDLVGNWWQGVQDWFTEQGKSAGDWLAEKLHELSPDLFPLVPSGPQLPKGGTDVLPPNNNSSFPGGGFPGLAPLALSSAASGPSSADTYYIEQHIGLNGDFGGARQGAESGIREALINRRLKT